jgi:hypothetical protein
MALLSAAPVSRRKKGFVTAAISTSSSHDGAVQDVADFLNSNKLSLERPNWAASTSSI